jgi:hypothetical protein
MARSRKVWIEVGLAIAAIYAIALMFQMFNEFFDKSAPLIEEAIVVQKFTRYNPVPIAVLRVRNANGAEYNLDVLDELASTLVPGAALGVVRKNGYLGKEWVQDREFYQFLNGTRTIQGFIYLAFAGFIVICWLFIAKKRFSSIAKATGSLFGGVLLAFGVFWLLP